MASERAKELQARQKAEAQAAKLAKKNSTDPKDWGTIRQLKESYTMVVDANPSWKWLLIASLVGPLVVGVGLGLILGHWLYGTLTGLLAGASLAMLVLGRLVRKAAYKRYEGQVGAAQVALMMLTGGRKPKWSYTAAISGNRQGDTVHRAVGPGGLILIGDGEAARLGPILGAERKRHEQLLYDVKVQTFIAGDGEGQVPVEKLASTIEKLPKKLSQTQIAEIESRLKAMDVMRSRVPLPRGPMPSLRGAHKAMRGK